jgi:hypothetical protein
MTQTVIISICSFHLIVSHMTRNKTIICVLALMPLGTLMSCGGGGGGGGSSAPAPSNSLPVANSDSFSLIINTPAELDLLTNDSDSDGALASIRIISNPSNGVISGLNIGASPIYTPNNGFIGEDSFTYAAIDNVGGSSNAVTVSLTIEPITETSLRVTSLRVPTSGYEALNNADLNASVLTSLPEPFKIPPNPVSFALYLTGTDVDNNSTKLLLTRLVDPTGSTLPNLNTQVSFCEAALCASLLPRREGQIVMHGDWQYTLGTRATSIASIDFTDMRLQLAVRTGPEPDADNGQPAVLKVQPFKTATSINEALFSQMLRQFVSIAGSNGFSINLQPTIIVSEPEYAEISGNFTDTTTAELVTLGAADSINIFFIEGFTGIAGGGRLGISPGIPGTLGVKGQFNGILINATATNSADKSADYYARTTAEFAFHEMGHLLGLFHTTESNFTNDIIDDTPNCLLAQHDTVENDSDNRVGRADQNECPDGLNPMFWTNDLDTPKQILSKEQRRVIDYSPIAK